MAKTTFFHTSAFQTSAISMKKEPQKRTFVPTKTKERFIRYIPSYQPKRRHILSVTYLRFCNNIGILRTKRTIIIIKT